jgi:hypothetical protein
MAIKSNLYERRQQATALQSKSEVLRGQLVLKNRLFFKDCAPCSLKPVGRGLAPAEDKNI